MRDVTCEPLESRRLLASSFAPFAVKVNFQRLIDPTVPPGYRDDIGAPYGRRSNGLTYGWSSDVSASALNRNDPRSPDERYDTFNYLGNSATWQLAVPEPGAYRVRVVAGDPKVFNSTFRIAAEHVIVTEGIATTSRRWFDGTATVSVTDGALTLTSAPGAINNKLCFVEVVRVQPPAAPPLAASATNARPVSTVTNVVTWADNSGDESGFKIERKRGSSGAYEAVGLVRAGVTRFVDRQLRPATTYTYRVRAFNAAGGSAASTQDPARTFPTGGPLGWEAIAPSPIPRAEALTAAVAGRLFVFGGFSGSAGPVVRSDVYDPVTNGWSRLPDLPARLTHAGVAVDGRNVYFAGGYVGVGPGFEQEFGTNLVWRYHVDLREYTRMPDLPAKLASGGLVVLGRQLHYFGGNDAARQDVGVHYVLNLDNPTAWTTAAALPNGRSHLGYAALGGKIYAIGGQFDNDAELTTSPLVHVWDPAAPGAWTQRASLPLATSHIASSTFVLGNRIVVAGGETGHEDPTASVFAYDPLSDLWASLTPLPGARFSGAARAMEGVVYFSGGSSQTATYRGVFAG